jgi:hypothetical protein
MRKLFFLLVVTFTYTGCSDTELSKYSGNQLTYQLLKSSDYDYSGQLEVKELMSGALEFNISLMGKKGDASINYPAHLHFGGYDSSEAMIAAMLNPVNSASLKSTTIVSQLSTNIPLNFESFKNFSGHIKVHLAGDGPDYKIILVSGNVGKLSSSSTNFDSSKIEICQNSF